MVDKEKCKDIMSGLFGPATAEWVDGLSDSEVIDKCKAKVTALFGAEKAKVFEGM